MLSEPDKMPTKRMPMATGLVALLALMLSWTLALGEDPEPEQVVEETANQVVQAVVARREELRQDPDALHALVEEHLLPHVDDEYVARLVLGVHWRRASPEQRDRFHQVFYQSLVRTYAEGLLEVTDERVRVLPRRGELDPQRTMVRTEVLRGNAPPISVNYVLRRAGSDWLVYDVIIEGISYVSTYRSMFSSEINRSGLDALIERLERGEIKPAPKGRA